MFKKTLLATLAVFSLTSLAKNIELLAMIDQTGFTYTININDQAKIAALYQAVYNAIDINNIKFLLFATDPIIGGRAQLLKRKDTKTKLAKFTGGPIIIKITQDKTLPWYLKKFIPH